jgi:hypothetical protein
MMAVAVDSNVFARHHGCNHVGNISGQQHGSSFTILGGAERKFAPVTKATL